MKRLNKYIPSLLVFNYQKPSISIKNQYDKLIIKGNKINRNICILLKINDIEILKKLKDKSFNFILDINFINDNIFYLNTISNNIVVLEKNNISNNRINYCYSDTFFYSYCKDYKIYTIKPTFITNNYFYNTYNILENGKIIAYNILNENNLKDIEIVISYIKNLNYNIVSIDDLIKE